MKYITLLMCTSYFLMVVASTSFSTGWIVPSTSTKDSSEIDEQNFIICLDTYEPQ